MKATTTKTTTNKNHNLYYSVGDQATLCGYTDRRSYTVIATTATTITLQENKRELLNGINSGEPDALRFTPGGFSGHTDGTQRWKVEQDPEGHIIKAHMKRKPRKVWTQKQDGEYGYVFMPDFRNGSSIVIPGAHDYYDFNF